MSNWRVGSKVPINVYEGDRPVCQCHIAEDARRIVAAMNAMPEKIVCEECGADCTNNCWGIGGVVFCSPCARRKVGGRDLL